MLKNTTETTCFTLLLFDPLIKVDGDIDDVAWKTVPGKLFTLGMDLRVIKTWFSM